MAISLFLKKCTAHPSIAQSNMILLMMSIVIMIIPILQFGFTWFVAYFLLLLACSSIHNTCYNNVHSILFLFLLHYQLQFHFHFMLTPNPFCTWCIRGTYLLKWRNEFHFIITQNFTFFTDKLYNKRFILHFLVLALRENTSLRRSRFFQVIYHHNTVIVHKPQFVCGCKPNHYLNCSGPSNDIIIDLDTKKVIIKLRL